jgi:hypothetical protein
MKWFRPKPPQCDYCTRRASFVAYAPGTSTRRHRSCNQPGHVTAATGAAIRGGNR